MVSIANQRATSWLEEANLRPTRQRLCLAEVLVGDGRDKHVTAETLFVKVQQTGYTVSLATVGYGDVYPVTAGGKIFASIISLIGIGIVAIPTGIISASFVEEIHSMRRGKKE